jgi:hypothetical protein
MRADFVTLGLATDWAWINVNESEEVRVTHRIDLFDMFGLLPFLYGNVLSP